MQKILFGVFAHPDDEAFGPAGTLLLEARAGTELHLITLTAGQDGMNPDSHENLADIRLQEWREAGKILGAKKMYHFGYLDGLLSNTDHLQITAKLERLVEETIKDRDCTVEFISTDFNGVTGHIDHIVAARSACLAFCRLRERGVPMTRVRLACLSKDQAPRVDTTFCLMEAGHEIDSITETIDARNVLDDVLTVMHCHHSQRGDAEAQISALGDGVAINHFIVPEF